MTMDDLDSDQTAEAPEAAETEASADPMVALEQERDQFKAIAQRTQADFINYKRRMEEERLLISRNASNQVLMRLLPIVDDLQRAAEALPEEASASWGEGVKMILQNLQALLQSEGVEGYEPAPGDTFDPNEHEAVYYQPTEEQPTGTVLSVVRAGYRSADRVLRPAQVVVARDPNGAAPADNGEAAQT